MPPVGTNRTLRERRRERPDGGHAAARLRREELHRGQPRVQGRHDLGRGGHPGQHGKAELAGPPDHRRAEAGRHDEPGAGVERPVHLLRPNTVPGADQQPPVAGHRGDRLLGGRRPEGHLGHRQAAVHQGRGQRPRARPRRPGRSPAPPSRAIAPAPADDGEPRTHSCRQPPAVDGQHGAGDVVRRGRRQEDDRAGEIVGPTPPAGRDAVEDRARCGRRPGAAPRCCRWRCSRARWR